MRRRVNIKGINRVLMTLLLAGLGACAYAPAQYPGDGVKKDRPPETRQVTGSRIPTEIDPDENHPKTMIPVTIISRDDIDRSGAISIGGVLRSHPAIWGGGGR